MNWGFSNEGTVLVSCCVEETEVKVKAFGLLVHLCFNSYLGLEVWVATEIMRSRLQAVKIGFLLSVAGFSLGDRVRSSGGSLE